jgi:cholesterol oxidase
MYGLLWEHANLNEATHATLHETFGVANIEVFEHLAACVRAGHVVDRAGRDVYLAHPERMRLPVCFLHGAENQTFLPETTRRTYEWLRAHNGPALYSRHQVVGYGHLDCWIGREAARDVFPLVLAHLERAG